jgi:hypothetical protein
LRFCHHAIREMLFGATARLSSIPHSALACYLDFKPSTLSSFTISISALACFFQALVFCEGVEGQGCLWMWFSGSPDNLKSI